MIISLYEHCCTGAAEDLEEVKKLLIDC